MMLLEQQTILLPQKAMTFTVVCALCVQQLEVGEYLAATVAGTLPLDADHSSITCPQGHDLRIERTA
jgi:hypothetical protein